LAISIWRRIIDWDQRVFLVVNGKWANPVFDTVLPFFRNPVFWAPLYLFVLIFILLNFGKKGLWWALLFICTVALTDLIGAQVFKENIKRIRPCNDPILQFHVRLLLKHCANSYSFVSNHAANHFGMATFSFLTFKGILKKWIYLAFAWAFFVAYAQVYVGIHYPLDVIGGALLGIIMGYLTARLFHQKWGSLHLDNQLL
jgi:membrane-associated phospholipid phosphatase